VKFREKREPVFPSGATLKEVRRQEKRAGFPSRTAWMTVPLQAGSRLPVRNSRLCEKRGATCWRLKRSGASRRGSRPAVGAWFGAVPGPGFAWGAR